MPGSLALRLLLVLVVATACAHDVNASEPCPAGYFLDDALGCLLCPEGKWSAQTGLLRE